VSTASILWVPLASILRADIANTLRYLLHLTTIGEVLTVWSSLAGRRAIERSFDSPAQAAHAVATWAVWLNPMLPAPAPVASPWWNPERSRAHAPLDTQ
jgi:hypothetical protein